jgi:hypothetical protein
MDAFWITALILSGLFLANELRCRIKYSNFVAFINKEERLSQLNETIRNIESNNNEIREIIKTMDMDADFDDDFADRLVEYRDYEVALKKMKKERKEVQKYLRAACRYNLIS